MQTTNHPAPKPDNTAPVTPGLIKEGIASVESLSKSIREFPREFFKQNSITETACGVSAAIGLILGLLLANLAKKAK